MLLAAGPLALAETPADAPPALGSSKWDRSFGFVARSRPIGAIFTSEFGRGFLLWGSPKDESRWRYGYVRPAVQLESIAVNTRVAVEVEIFPVSFFGFAFRNEYGLRLIEPTTIACGSVQCTGGLWRSSAEARWGLEAAGIFWVGSATVTAASALSEAPRFYEDRSVLVGEGPADRLVTFRNIAGYRFNESWLAGVFHEWNGMKRAGTHADLTLGILRRSLGRWALTAGAGHYRSDVTPRGLSAVMMLQWTGEKGLGLF
ncbi:MAG: hypothetical protein IT285_01275 [Bdellovibrionales bacterium]|nr:hypothetical protein [Bdellovibrionales bacterium]